jgi:hypothetical protein
MTDTIRKSREICCGRIDPTQAVKATGFNHREHRVFKPILCVPLCSLWLYSLPMSFMSIAVLCIQLTITEIAISINFNASVFNASVDGRAVTAEHAENAEDRIGLKTLRPLRSPR